MGRVSKSRKSRIQNLHAKRENDVESKKLHSKNESSSNIKLRNNLSNVFNCENVVQGNFNQSNLERYNNNSGKQCVANSLMAITYSVISSIENWESHSLDLILDEGNDLYTMIRMKQTVHDFLLINELPKIVKAFNKQFIIEISNESQVGLLGTNMHIDNDHIMTLYEALQTALIQYYSCFITFGNNTFCVMKQNQSFYIFDSHSRDISGLLAPNGKSVMIKKDNVVEICTHCNNLAHSLNLAPTTQFEVTGINVILHSTIQSESDVKQTDSGDNDVNICSEEVHKFLFKPLSNNQINDMCLLLGLVKYCQNYSESKPLFKPSKIKSIQGHGDCFFRSISYALTQSEDYHRRIRLAVVKHMKLNQKLFTPFLRVGYNSIEDYILSSKMRLLGSWATELEILATANLLQTNIFTYSNKKWVKFSRLQNVEVDMNTGIYLNHKDGNHYDVVLDVMDNDACTYDDAGNEEDKIRQMLTGRRCHYSKGLFHGCVFDRKVYRVYT